MSRRSGRPEAGVALVGALAGITIMMILMAMAMPTWRYVVKDDREEELIFRGGQIADAIARAQRETRAVPVSLEFLVQKKFLRKAYKDPMTKDGKWRFVRPGEVIPPPLPFSGTSPGQERSGKDEDEGGRRAERGGGGDKGGDEKGLPGRPSTFGPMGPGTGVGPILGVVSTSKEKSLRLFNGRSRYDQWYFVVGQPRIVGRPPLVIPGAQPPGGPGGPGGKPGAGAPKR